MKPLALVLLLLLLVVALRRREPERMTPWHEDDDGVQPSDPYPASLLP